MRSCRRDEECSSSLRRASYKKLRKIGYFLSTMASISKKFIDFRLFTRARVSAGGRENPRVPVARGPFFVVDGRQMSNFVKFRQDRAGWPWFRRRNPAFFSVNRQHVTHSHIFRALLAFWRTFRRAAGCLYLRTGDALKTALNAFLRRVPGLGTKKPAHMSRFRLF